MLSCSHAVTTGSRTSCLCHPRRHEAKQLPDVVTATGIDPAALEQQHRQGQQQQRQPRRGGGTLSALPPHTGAADVAACPPGMRPSVSWLRAFLHQFAQLRRALQREQEALLLPPGQPSPTAAAAAGVAGLSLEPLAPAPALPSAAMPELRALRGLGQSAVLAQLRAAVQRLEQQQGDGSGGSCLTPADAAALYALAARVERPLAADTAALFRALLRCCAAARAALPGGPRDPLLPHLNVLTAIAGAYFGQDEELAGLWEEEDDD